MAGWIVSLMYNHYCTASSNPEGHALGLRGSIGQATDIDMEWSMEFDDVLIIIQIAPSASKPAPRLAGKSTYTLNRYRV
jgi:hypothetical protein